MSGSGGDRGAHGTGAPLVSHAAAETRGGPRVCRAAGRRSGHRPTRRGRSVSARPQPSPARADVPAGRVRPWVHAGVPRRPSGPRWERGGPRHTPAHAPPRVRRPSATESRGAGRERGRGRAGRRLFTKQPVALGGGGRSRAAGEPMMPRRKWRITRAGFLSMRRARRFLANAASTAGSYLPNELCLGMFIDTPSPDTWPAAREPPPPPPSGRTRAAGPVARRRVRGRIVSRVPGRIARLSGYCQHGWLAHLSPRPGALHRPPPPPPPPAAAVWRPPGTPAIRLKPGSHRPTVMSGT